jgi:hypothetical protein
MRIRRTFQLVRAYSVPTRFAFQNVLVKGFVDEVVIVGSLDDLFKIVR